MSGTTSGKASFGQAYDWTARPASLKVTYKANVGKIDFVGSSDDSSLTGKLSPMPKSRSFGMIQRKNRPKATIP